MSQKCTCEARRQIVAVYRPVHGERKRYRKRADGVYEIITDAERYCEHFTAHCRRISVRKFPGEFTPRYVCAVCRLPVRTSEAVAAKKKS